MNEFIEKNKRLLRTYCVAARIIGWILLIVPSIICVIGILLPSKVWGQAFNSLIILPTLVLDFMFPGLIALCVAQFIRYLYQEEHIGKLLRYGDKILYIYALLVVMGSISKYIFNWVIIGRVGALAVSALCLSFPAAAKVLVLIGLAQILRRVLPVIEESKTLV